MHRRVAFAFSGFSLFVGNLNSNKDFDEIKATLRKFFSKNDLEIADIRLGNSRYYTQVFYRVFDVTIPF